MFYNDDDGSFVDNNRYWQVCRGNSTDGIIPVKELDLIEMVLPRRKRGIELLAVGPEVEDKSTLPFSVEDTHFPGDDLSNQNSIEQSFSNELLQFLVRPKDAPEDISYDIAIVDLTPTIDPYYSQNLHDTRDLSAARAAAKTLLERLGFSVFEREISEDYRELSLRQEMIIVENENERTGNSKPYQLEKDLKEGITIHQIYLKDPNHDNAYFYRTLRVTNRRDIDLMNIPATEQSENNVIYIRELSETEILTHDLQKGITLDRDYFNLF